MLPILMWFSCNGPLPLDNQLYGDHCRLESVMEMVFMGRSFSPTTLLGIALVVAPTAWSLIRSAAQPKPEEIPVHLSKAA